MGEATRVPIQLYLDRRLKPQFCGATVTSGAALLTFRELDKVLALSALAEDRPSDDRQGKNTQHSFVRLMRQVAFGRLAGYKDVNDAGRRRVEPAMRFHRGWHG